MYVLKVYRLKFPKYIVFLSLKIDLVTANSAHPDEMPPYAAFHLGIHCLHSINSVVSSHQKVNNTHSLEIHETWNLCNFVNQKYSFFLKNHI